MLLACCLSNISEKKNPKVKFFNALHQSRVVRDIKLHKRTDILTDQVDFAVALHVVKRCVDPGGFTMQHCKPTPIGFPGKGNDALCITDKNCYVIALEGFTSPSNLKKSTQEFQQTSL